VVSAMVFIVAYSIISILLPSEKSFLPNEYTPKALMIINDSKSSGGALSSMLSSSGMGGLAGLAGISVSGGQTYSSLAVYLVKTNNFLDTVIDKFNLVERYNISKSPKATTRDALKELLIADFDDKSSVFSISFTDIDPQFAQEVVNYSVEYMENVFEDLGLDQNKRKKQNLEINLKNTLNEIQTLEQETQQLGHTIARGGQTADGLSVAMEMTRLQMELEAQKQVYTQLKTQYELLKVEMASETPVFQILELAEVPDRKSGPSRGMLCIIVTFAAGFFAVMLAFMLEAIENVKKDPEAMKKLTGKE
ncbi:MAG TPA: GNVR domain-containing protein, partial [Treponemataceae bacterium]|nr:GNVR domain-containing protein [Treponemataceae bacterium]